VQSHFLGCQNIQHNGTQHTCIQHKDTQHSNFDTGCFYGECHLTGCKYVECYFMLHVTIKTIMFNFVKVDQCDYLTILTILMLSVVILNVNMLTFVCYMSLCCVPLMPCVTTKPIELILKLSVTLKPIILSVIMLSGSMLVGILLSDIMQRVLAPFWTLKYLILFSKGFINFQQKYNLQNWFETCWNHIHLGKTAQKLKCLVN
jgi:hypothetical protein